MHPLAQPRRKRAIVGSRVSRITEEGKVSQDTQKAAGQRWCEAYDVEIIGYFEDLDVSATVSPWDRPDLGPWFKKADEFDYIVWSKVDRAFRSAKDSADVAHWAEQNNKGLIFPEDGIICDFASPDSQATAFAKVFLMLASVFAEMELKRIKGRNLETKKTLSRLPRISGGVPPYGYRIVNHPEGGKTLAIDPETSLVVEEIADHFLAGKSTRDIAEILTAKGYPTPAMVNESRRKGANTRKTPVGTRWVLKTISIVLRSQTTMGWKVHGTFPNHRLARDEDGMPIRLAPALLSEEKWAAVQAEVGKRLMDRGKGVVTHRKGASPLLGIIYCYTCMGPMYLNRQTAKRGEKTYQYRYYVCNGDRNPGLKPCPGVFREDSILPRLTELVTEDIADVPVMRRVFVPGEDHTQELETVMAAIQNYLGDRENGVFSFPGGDKVFAEKMAALNRRATELAALPQRADGWDYVETGETFADAYKRMTDEQRRLMLVDAGVKLYASKEAMFLALPEDLKKKAQTFAADLVTEDSPEEVQLSL